MAKVARLSFLGRLREAQRAKVVNFAARVKQRFTYKLPDKYKDTWVDRLVSYWQNLVRDYKEAGLDTLRDIRARPLRASVYGGLLTSAYLCAKRNPDEMSYRASLIEAHTDMAFTCSSIQNKSTVAHLRSLENLHNSGLLRYFSFGVVSIVWLDNYDKHLGLFEAQCEYLQPTYLEILQHRVLDVGFWNRWWFLERSMKDFDVNDEEWTQSDATSLVAN